MGDISLDQLASYAEIFGVFAVVGSLAYVGMQIRQNTHAMRISAAQAHLEGYRGIIANFVLSSSLADVWYRGINGVSNLRDEELVQFFAQLGLMLNFSESSYLQWKKSALFDDQWVGIVGVTTDIMGNRGAQEFWQHRRHWFGPEFQDWIEGEVMKSAGMPLYAPKPLKKVPAAPE